MTKLNRRIIVWLTGGIVFFIFSVCAVHADTLIKKFPRINFGQIGTPVGKMNFVTKTSLPTVPSDICLYNVKPVKSKKDTLLNIFKALPIKSTLDINDKLLQLERLPESQSSNGKRISANIGGWLVETWSDGKFIINNTNLLNCPDDANKLISTPTPEEARQTADDFLAQLNILPSNVHFAKVQPGEWDTYGAGDKPDDVVVRSQLVSYSAEIDGIPVYASISVYVGPGPKVVSAVSLLSQVVSGEKVPILCPQEALSKLMSGECFVDDGPSWDATADITSINLVYYPVDVAPGGDCSQMMPVYVFRGEAVADSKRANHWRAFVEATRPEYLEGEPGRE